MKNSNVPTTATDDSFTMAICGVVDIWLEQKSYFHTLREWIDAMPDYALDRLKIPTAGQFEEFVEKVSILSADHDQFTVEQIQEIIDGLEQKTETQIDRIRKYVKAQFQQKYALQPDTTVFWRNRDRIIDIGVSILCTAWKVGLKGGSFVQAVAINDLYLAFKTADATNRKCLDFYSELVNETVPIK